MNLSYKNSSEFFPELEEDDDSGHAHRQLIGIVGLVLPLLLWFFAGWRPTEGLAPWVPLRSVSAYYYTEAVTAFAGCLVALAFFLFTYRGYKNEYGRRDRIASNIAAGAALLVAIFPAGTPNNLPTPDWWTPPIGWVHYFSAAILFGSFIFFSLVQFPKSKLNKKDFPRDKKIRNGIYILCGVAIIVCIAWVAIALFIGAPIFLPEVLALEFFAISWLVKGRADMTAYLASRAALYYGRHPRQLMDKAQHAVGGKHQESIEE